MTGSADSPAQALALAALAAAPVVADVPACSVRQRAAGVARFDGDVAAAPHA